LELLDSLSWALIQFWLMVTLPFYFVQLRPWHGCAVKVYGQYGGVSKHYDTAYQVVNYGLCVNKFAVPHQKLGGQHS
jgi:hypothetical protein